MFVLIILLFALPSIYVAIDFFRYIYTGKRILKNLVVAFLIEVIVIVGLPLFYLILMDDSKNDCCNDSATFSPDHKITIWVLIGICMINYFYSSLKFEIHSPVLEVLNNAILLFTFVFNIFIGFQIGPLGLLGNISIGLLCLTQLLKNHHTFIEFSKDVAQNASTKIELLAWKILELDLLRKVPLLLILCMPLLTGITALLLLFGQKPDSLIRAFTDTYKHGFSELDHMCYNVHCGGHFLCSVAANGHQNVVKPIRYGERNNSRIICNRQLLVANAFEELIQDQFPRLHHTIRKNYNKVGDAVHKHYGFFSYKLVSDVVYVLMKPLEMVFLAVLYIADKRPENRIGRQYLNQKDRQQMHQYRIQNRI